MDSRDITESLVAGVRQAIGSRCPVVIKGNGSKRFYGYPAAPGLQNLGTGEHRGVIDYAPEELVIRVRAGTRLSDINQLLSDHNQLLPFEPPDFGAGSTIGGAIATGLSGPRRPYAGSARDFVLGLRLITGTGEVLEFGGQVMKNVAGYDVSRLVTGSMGTLGVILDVSLKVLPAPEVEVTLKRPATRLDFPACLRSIRKSSPISAAAHWDGHMFVRLSGSTAAVKAVKETIGGEETDNRCWDELNTLECFSDVRNLWRVSVAPASGLFLEDAAVIDWGGGIRWLADPGYDPRKELSDTGGYATLIKHDEQILLSGTEIFQPLSETVMGIQQRLKRQFDPAGIFNPGRMYREF